MASRNLEYAEFVIEGEQMDHYQAVWCQRVSEYYDKHELPVVSV